MSSDLTASPSMRVALVCFTSSYLARCIEEKGHHVTTIDTSAGAWKNHVQEDALKHLQNNKYDFVIACPPCTYLTRAQFTLLKHSFSRKRKAVDAINWSRMLWAAAGSRKIFENPPGLMSRALGKRYTLVHPWQFGDPYRKELCFWLDDVAPLIDTYVSPVRKPVSNHVNSRMSQVQKMHVRSSWDRFPLFCHAIADQWFAR